MNFKPRKLIMPTLFLAAGATIATPIAYGLGREDGRQEVRQDVLEYSKDVGVRALHATTACHEEFGFSSARDGMSTYTNGDIMYALVASRMAEQPDSHLVGAAFFAGREETLRSVSSDLKQRFSEESN